MLQMVRPTKVPEELCQRRRGLIWSVQSRCDGHTQAQSTIRTEQYVSVQSRLYHQRTKPGDSTPRRERGHKGSAPLLQMSTQKNAGICRRYNPNENNHCKARIKDCTLAKAQAVEERANTPMLKPQRVEG